LKQPIDEVVVIDNGSTDDTASVARGAGAHVVSEPRRGYGYACAAGIQATADADVLVFIDGDYSFLPGEMRRLLAPILEGCADLVLGSRALGAIAPGAMPPHQRFGNWLAARLMTYLYGLPVTDLGPYRAVRGELARTLDMREMIFGWLVEMIIKATRRGARIVEVPVSYHSRRAGHSKVSGTLRGSALAAYHILAVTLRYAR
jgi:glycosyltransferase involved in cell wall biosynthesis